MGRTARFGGLLVSLLALGGTARTAGAEAEKLSDVQPLLDSHCFKCHNAERKKGGVDLARFKDEASVHRDPKTWETVLGQLRERTMPPEDKPQPTAEERDRLIRFVEATLDNLDLAGLPKDPGQTILHRLSRLEYNNTVRDLFGVDTRPADKFPADGGGGGGFDNNAATLFIPPILMERYLEAAVEIVNQASRDRLFIVKPGFLVSKRAAAQRILAHFATRAFRRPVEPEEVTRLVALYDQSRSRGSSHEDAVRLGLRSLLVSPNFLFRVEEDRPAKEPYRVNDYELASRLSYFLWSSMPDEILFDLAARQQLGRPEILETQVRRMLLDSKARTFAENFTSQWLRTRDLMTAAQPDARKYPEYTTELRDAMYAEPVEFFLALVRENGSLLDFIEADYALLNERLAKHYGIEGVTGDQFRRVPLVERERGGVFGMGAMLTLTSYPRRTSPVLRGKWVLEELLGTPPPPPPPLVKSLPPDDRPRDGLSFRQRLEQHRADPNCANCHKRMDPLGFGLENFDGIGRWRTKLGDEAIDASGEMPNGEKFTGPSGLRKVVLSRTNDFSKNVTEKMLAYALGRGLEYYDTPTVRHVSQALAKDGYRVTRLIAEVVKSYPFQHRRPGEPMGLTQK